jgi:hypothetical protein
MQHLRALNGALLLDLAQSLIQNDHLFIIATESLYEPGRISLSPFVPKVSELMCVVIVIVLVFEKKLCGVDIKPMVIQHGQVLLL